MESTPSLEQFFATHAADVSITNIAANLLVAAVLCAILGWFYVRFGTSMSNRRQFAKIFVLLGVTTALVIMIVKSSLALSLGLVGALSIVRFRAPIKEPEELAFLFLTIGIGLGAGADQSAATVVSFVIILFAHFCYQIYPRKTPTSGNFFLTVRSGMEGKELSNFVEIVAAVVRDVTDRSVLKRVEKQDGLVEVVFVVELSGLDAVKRIETAFSELPAKPSFVLVEDIRIA